MRRLLARMSTRWASCSTSSSPDGCLTRPARSRSSPCASNRETPSRSAVSIPRSVPRSIARSPAAWRLIRTTATARRSSSARRSKRPLSGRDSAATIALDTAVTERLATRRIDAVPVPVPAPPPPVRRREPAPAAPRRAARAPARPAPPRDKRRGAFPRFLALLFLFLLIAAIVAGVVVLNSDSQQAQEFERVARDTITEQVDGLRALIDDATK